MKTAKLALYLILVVLVRSEHLQAQQCSRSDIDFRPLIEEAIRTCSPRLLYNVAAVWEGRTAPELRALYAGQWQSCEQGSRAARAALAKLGDTPAFEAIETELRTKKLNENAIKELGLIGDDRAIAALMTYMVERDSDQTRIVSFGDYDYDPMYEVAAAMRGIASRRLLKGATSAEIGAGWEWKKWWKSYNGVSVSVPVHQSVSEPYLRCLARKVDWDFPNAILEMASQRGKAAESTLRSFPRFPPRQAFGTMSGNLEAALAKLGDREVFSEIVAELQEDQSYFSSAVRKLEFIGNKEAIDTLLGALGVPTKGLAKAKASLSSGAADKYERFLAEESYRVELQVDREFHLSILQALAHIVERPPLGADATPTPENFQTWRDWWAKNRDRAELVRTPPGTFE